jgi:uncharacterized protein with GYD domain
MSLSRRLTFRKNKNASTELARRTFYKAIFNFLADFLTSLCFQEHSRGIPLEYPLRKEILMPFYCHQVSYTKEAWARLMDNPQDRLEAVRAPIEKLGGSLQTSFFAFGEFDVLAITEMPDNISAAAIAIAFAAGGAVANIRTTPLLTASQAVEALRKAGICGYKSITEISKAATAP